MPGFAVQNNPPKGCIWSDPAQGSFGDTQRKPGHLCASSSCVSGTSEVGEVKFGFCGFRPQPLTPPSFKLFGMESYRGLSLHQKLQLGERTSKVESYYKKKTQWHYWDDVLRAGKLHSKHLSPDAGNNYLRCASFAPCDTSQLANRNSCRFMRFTDFLK